MQLHRMTVALFRALASSQPFQDSVYGRSLNLNHNPVHTLQECKDFHCCNLRSGPTLAVLIILCNGYRLPARMLFSKRNENRA